MTLVSLGLVGHNASLSLVGAGAYLIGGPIIHVSHGHPGKAAGSFFLRAGLSALAGLVGYDVGLSTWTDDHTSDSRSDRIAAGIGGFFVGLIAGGVVAAAVDDLLVAREPIRKDAAVTVVLLPSPGGGRLAVAGRF